MAAHLCVSRWDAEVTGIFKVYAYKIISQMNKELAKTGCITISSRIDRKYFYEQFYGAKNQNNMKVWLWRHSKTRTTASGMCRSATLTGKVGASKNSNGDLLPKRGTGIPDGEAGRYQYDLWKLCHSLQEGRQTKAETQYLAYQREYYPEEDPTVFRQAKAIGDHS